MKKLTAEQRKLVDQFAAMHQEHAHTVDVYNKLKKQVAELVKDDKLPTLLTLDGNKFSVDFSEPTKGLECVYTPKEFVEMTQAWDALSISTTKAKELLSPEQMDTLFIPSPGGRRFKRVRVRMPDDVRTLPASSKKTPKPAVPAANTKRTNSRLANG